MLKEGAEVSEGDVAFASTLFPNVACYFVVDQAREHAPTINASLIQQRGTSTNCLFIIGERRNEWLSAKARFKVEEFDVIPLSDGEIDRLLDFLAAENALGELQELDRSFQFSIVKNKHEMQLLVAMREATAGDGVGFDAIIENEYRGVEEGKSPSVARELYLLVCCFYQHGILIRDQLLESVLGWPLTTLHEEVGNSLDGLVEYVETDIVRGQYAARARHRIIAQIVWRKCGSRERREGLLQKTMEKLNLTYALDKRVFDLFIQSDEIVDFFSSLEGKVKFFDTAVRRDSENPFVLQHYARMLLREKKQISALAQIDSAITKDKGKSIRALHHTRGLVLAELAMIEENGDVARKWMLQSEREFLHCITVKENDDYGHGGLATLYLHWSRRPKISSDESAEYLEKAETVIDKGLRVVKDRSSLLVISAGISKDLGDQPERLSKLRQAVESNSASAAGRFMLGRAYRERGMPEKTISVLDPIIRTDFKDVRAYVEYTRAMLDLGEPVAKCAATLSQCRLDGDSDPAFVGLYAGLLYMDGKYVDANKIWEDAKEQSFSYDDRTKRQYTPYDSGEPRKRVRFSGSVQLRKPGNILLRPDEGTVVISRSTSVGKTVLQPRQRVTFELSFSAKSPLAENLSIA